MKWRIRFAGSVFTVIFLSSLSTGCKLGSYVEESPPARDPASTVFSEAYATQPDQVSFCVKLREEDDANCVQARPDEIPEPFRSDFTNPLQFTYDRAQYFGVLHPPGTDPNRVGVLVYVKDFSGWELTASGSDELVNWPDLNGQSCLQSFSTLLLGNVLPGGASGVVNGTPVNGAINIRLSHTRANGVDCKGHLKEMEQCYQDVAKCPIVNGATQDELQEWVNIWFNRWIETGALRIEDISEVEQMTYEILYR